MNKHSRQVALVYNSCQFSGFFDEIKERESLQITVWR